MSSNDEATFSAPEGIFTLVDEIKPPLLHSQVAQSPNLHPSRITTITVTFPAKAASHGFASLLWRLKDDPDDKEKDLAKEKEAEREREEKERREERKDYSDSVSESENAEDGANLSENEGAPTLGPDTVQPSGIFSPVIEPAGGKKKSASRATHNIRSTSSSFVTRIHTTEGLSRLLSSKQGDATFVFYNGAKSFFWSEIGASSKEPLARVTFTAYPTCHDINRTTSSYENLDVIIGFNTGDLMWFDPLSSRYVRINKQGSVTTSPCTCVRWVPGTKSMFLSAHADGTIIVYDKEREDGPFTAIQPGETPSGTIPPEDLSGAPRSTSVPFPSSDGDVDKPPIWNPLEDMLVTRPPTPPPAPKGEKPARNPVSHWRLCRRAITDFQFSPDMRQLAVVSEDGCLRIIDPSAEKLLDTFSSYFGSLSCVAWTPDSRFVITGGQDDLVSIFSPRDQKIMARCQGHSSFVASVAVDWVRCDARGYRFGSVGEDKNVALWDFMPPNRARGQTMNRTASTGVGPGPERQGIPQAEGSNSRYHPAQARTLVPVIYPSMIAPIQGELLSNIAFVPSCMVTVTRPGCVKSWSRPIPREREMDMTAAQNALFGRSDVTRDVAAVA